MTDLSLDSLVVTVRRRLAAGDPETSYTARLAAKGVEKCAQKVGEEAVETAIAAALRDRDALVAESADLVFHLLVLLEVAGVGIEPVMAELDRRVGQSGLEEKAARKAAAAESP